jgi:hypothetical protein
MKLLFRLLRKGVNPLHLAWFALANLVGAVIVLLGIQAYKDAGVVLGVSDSALESDILVLSKPVSTATTLANALGSGPRSFNEREIQEIASLDGVASVAVFRTTHFPVFGGISFGGFYASTEMFVESVPDQYLDVDPSLWTASIDSTVIPLVIPRTYLNFYNYGFAAARGTPQLGEGLFSMVPLNLTFGRSNASKSYTGKIVGLSDRMNTILVPDSFLQEANRHFAPSVVKSPTRVLVEIESSSALMEHVDKKGYVIDGGGEDAARLLAVVRTIISVIVAFGLLVSILAFSLLLVSILLLIEKNRYKNDTLHQLGYPYRSIALPYQILAVGVDVAVWVSALIAVVLLYPLMTSLMQTISPDFEPSGLGLVLLSSLGLCLLFAAVHILLIRHKIRSR